MTDSREVFSGKELIYENSRPGYPVQAIDFLYGKLGFSENSVIADIGSGTGKFAELLIKRGSTVICVEPNNDMQKIAKEKFDDCPNIRFTDGDCSNTKIEDSSIDFITAAQAFHRFDVQNFKNESKRVLKPNGKTILIWNRRDENDIVNIETAHIFNQFCPRFKGFGGGMKDESKIAEYYDGNYERQIYSNPLYYDREKFIERCLSGSYSLKAGDEQYEKYLICLNNIFDKYLQDGFIKVANNTVMYFNKRDIL